MILIKQMNQILILNNNKEFAQSAGTVEYNDCISEEG